ncbi:MAG: hypothetical protein QXE81_05400 [Desulfurococcaceae archaeon]
MRIIAKVLKLRQKSEENSLISVTGYYVEEENWNTHEIGEEVTSIINKLLEVAAEYTTKEREESIMVLTEVETTGMRVIIGESNGIEASTVLVPKPSYLRRILFYKCDQHGTCKTIHEFRPGSQIILYEGSLNTAKIDFDFAILECGEFTRVLFPHELVQPKAKTRETRRRKRRSSRRKKRARKKKIREKRSRA